MVKTSEIGYLGRDSAACGEIADPRFREIVASQNLWTEPLGLAEARPPPYFRSITRLKPSPQAELFE